MGERTLPAPWCASCGREDAGRRLVARTWQAAARPAILVCVEKGFEAKHSREELGILEAMASLAEGERKETSLLQERPERRGGACYPRARMEGASPRAGKRSKRARQTALDHLLPAGADDGPIEIAEYDPNWPACYVAERERLAALLPGVVIHHIGSTAVPKLAAKPIIDMMALVEDLEASVATVQRMAGYRLPARFNRKLLHRRFLCYPNTSYRTHHLHLVNDREDLDRCLRFRELLRRSEKLASDYAALKRELAARFKENRMKYTEAKSSFIENAQKGGVRLGS